MFVLTNGNSDYWFRLCFDSEQTALDFVRKCWTLNENQRNCDSIEQVTLNDCGWSSDQHDEIEHWNDVAGNEVTEPVVITAEILQTVTTNEDIDRLEEKYGNFEAEDDNDDD